jgi:glycosyltransferase involved in cell wall biosynthesis
MIEYLNDKEIKINGILTDILDETGREIPLLTVTMITFNHCHYLEKAILGVLNQKTDFDYKLLIGDDCSTDGSRDILQKYQKLFPSKIILKLPRANLGANINSFSNRILCKGKYICDNEGDDFWLDKFKLQKQVDFLEENADFNIVAGQNLRVIGDEFSLDKTFTSDVSVTNRFDYFKNRSFHVSTACYRNPKNYPKWILDIFSADKFLVFLVAGDRKIFIDNQIFSVYRIHDGGISKIKLSRVEKKKRLASHIQGLTMINEDFVGEHRNWYLANLEYFSLIERSMDKSVFLKIVVLLGNLPFLFRAKSEINIRLILINFFK